VEGVRKVSASNKGVIGFVVGWAVFILGAAAGITPLAVLGGLLIFGGAIVWGINS